MPTIPFLKKKIHKLNKRHVSMSLVLHTLTRIEYMLISLSRSSRSAIACTIMVSTLSGENLSLNLQKRMLVFDQKSWVSEVYREREWLRPKLMVDRSFGSSPSNSAASWSRIPRHKSPWVPSETDFTVTEMPSFLDIERARGRGESCFVGLNIWKANQDRDQLRPKTLFPCLCRWSHL